MLAPGVDWDVVGRYQRSSRITVVLVTASNQPGFFYREEIVTGVRLAQRDPENHRVVPVVLDALTDVDMPYGLMIKNAVVAKRSELDVVARRLLQALADMPSPRQPGPAESAAATIELLSAVDDHFQGIRSEVGDVVETLLAELGDVNFRRQSERHGLNPAVLLTASREHPNALRQWQRGDDGAASTHISRFSELLATAISAGLTDVPGAVAPAVASALSGHLTPDMLENLDLMLVPARSTSQEVVVFDRRGSGDVAVGSRTSLVARRMASLPVIERRFGGRDGILGDLVASEVMWISGRPGVGKSALAVHWAHRVKSEYDEVLYIDMHGLNQSARRTSRGAARILLDAMYHPIGSNLKDDDALFDHLAAVLARARCLLILDNARDAEQVSPIVRAGGAACIVITSRQRLQSFTEACLDVPPLSRSASTDLLSQDAPSADGAVLDRISELCDDLPLALRLVAARLRRQDMPATELARLLDAEHTRLDYLDVGDRAVRSAVLTSYDDMSASSRHAARYLSVAFGAAADADEMAVGLATDRHTTALALHRLVDASFAQCATAATAAGQFELAPLVRLVAAERSEAEDDPESVAEFRRRMARNLADRLISPNKTGVSGYAELALEVDPTRAEAALSAAVESHWWDIAEALAPELRALYSVQFDLAAMANVVDLLVTTYLETNRPDRAVLAATQLADDMKASEQFREPALGWSRRAVQLADDNDLAELGVKAAMLSSEIAVDLADFDAAIESSHKAVALAERNPLPAILIHPLLNLGRLLGEKANSAEALPYLKRATELADKFGVLGTRAFAHSFLGDTLAELGRLRKARKQHDLAAQLFAADSQPRNAAICTENSAYWCESTKEQLTVQLRAIDHWSRDGDERQLARSLCEMATTHLVLEQPDEAIAAFDRAEAIVASAAATLPADQSPLVDLEVRIRRAAARSLLRLDFDVPDLGGATIDGVLGMVSAELNRNERDAHLFIKLLTTRFINRVPDQFWLFKEPADAAVAKERLSRGTSAPLGVSSSK